MHRLGLTTQATNPRPSYGGKSGPLASPSAKKSNNVSSTKQDSFRPDTYKLSAVVETRTSIETTREPKSPWFSTTATTALPPMPPKEPKKLLKKHHADNESERSLKMKSSTSEDEDDGMQIMVSRSFYITDDQRSLASREVPYR